MANANRQRGIISYDNEENDGNLKCHISKNCCVFLILVTVGFIMYLPFTPFASNKRKFFQLLLRNGSFSSLPDDVNFSFMIFSNARGCVRNYPRLEFETFLIRIDFDKTTCFS